MKKNGILCIAIAVALLVGGVAAVSASEQAATITQSQIEAQGIANFNAIVLVGDVTTDDVDISGNNIVQDVMSGNTQVAVKGQLAGIIQVGDDNWIDIWL